MQNYFMGQDGFSWFIGVVEDRNDPWRAGRVRVRCLGHHSEDVIEIPTEELPWATPMMPVTAGANSGIGVSPTFLIEGTWVVGFFRDPAKQEPVIMGALPGFNAKHTTNETIASSSAAGGKSTKGGFKDPNGIFPTETYLDKPDTNVLCDGVYTKQHYTYQESHKDLFYPEAPKSVYSGATNELLKEDREHWFTSSGNSILEPINTQKEAEYPYNHVLETESGHYVEFDDTAGNERIQIFHRKGSFVEINPDGHITISGRGNVTNIVDGNLDTIVHGNYSLTVEGTMDVLSVGKLTELFKDDRMTTIKGTETLEITGAVKNTFKATLTEEVTGDVTQDYKVNLTTKIGALGSIKASGAMVVGGSSISFN